MNGSSFYVKLNYALEYQLTARLMMTDAIVEAYKRDIDRTLLIENVKLTPQQRSERFQQAMRLVFELQRSARQRRTSTVQSSNKSKSKP